MKSEIYLKIRKEYDEKRFNALAQAEYRLETVKKQVKGFVDIDKEIGKLSLEACKQILSHPNDTEKIAEQLSKRLAEKTKQRHTLVEMSGYAKDFLDAKFECQECNDTGIMGGVGGDLLCSCFKQKILENMFEESGLVKGKTAQFDKFDLSIFSDEKDEMRFLIESSPREHIEKIKNRCFNYIQKDFEVLGGKGFLFTGNTGTGKTFMAQCVANELLLKGRTVAYVSAPIMFDKINEARMTFGEDNYEDYFAGLKEAELLIIDDLGTETSTEAKTSNFLQLLNARTTLDLLCPHKTIISTNLSLAGIREKYDERIYSRIIGGFYLLKFGGEDLRVVTR